jgi:hypothetical protein
LAGTAAVLAALVASLAPAVSPASADGGGGEIMEYSGGGFPTITGPASPEEYEQHVDLEELGPGFTVRQIDAEEIVVENPEGHAVKWFRLATAHDAEGATVPTSLRLEGDAVILTVHHREGNPAANFAPFKYPITDGPGWEGGYRTISVELSEHNPPSTQQPPAAPTPCAVPSLHGLSLRAAKTKLHADHCSIGQVHLAAGATRSKGKVVKQFRLAGAELAGGAPVAVKLGAR